MTGFYPLIIDIFPLRRNKEIEIKGFHSHACFNHISKQKKCILLNLHNFIIEFIGSTHFSRIKRNLPITCDFPEDLSSTKNKAYLQVGAYQRKNCLSLSSSGFK